MSANGLLTSHSVCGDANPDSSFFIRKSDPLVVDNLVANTITCDSINLNEGILTCIENGSTLTLNGIPVGSGGGGTGTVESVAVLAPLTLTGDPNVNPTIGISLTNIVQTNNTQTITGAKKFAIFPQSITGAVPTDPDEFTNKLYVDTKFNSVSSIVGGLSSITDWSLYPAISNINAAAYKLSNVSEVQTPLITSAGNLSLNTGAGSSIVMNAANVDMQKIAIIDVNEISGETIQILADDSIQIECTAGTVALSGTSIDFNGKPLTRVGDITYDSATTTLTPGVFNINSDVQTKIQSAGNITLDAGLTGDVITQGLTTTITTGTFNVGSVGLPIVGGIGLYTAGTATLAATGAINIGSANYTSIENVRITNSRIEKEPSTADLQYEDVASIKNDLANLVIGTNNTITVAPNGTTTINTNNNNFTMTGGDGQVSFAGQYFNMYATSSIVMQTAQGTNNPIELRADAPNNVSIAEGPYDETTDPSSVLDVKSATRGMYLPRLTSAARTAIPLPQQGLALYDTNINSIMTYDGANWGKPAMTNVSNELLTNLSGKVSGTATRTLTGFNTVETGTVKTDVIQPVDPLVQPYVGIGADVSMPGNTSLSFGLVGGGNGTISVPSGTLNVNANNLEIDAQVNFNNAPLTGVSYISFEQQNTGFTPNAGNLDIVSDSTITTSFIGFPGTVQMKRDLTTFNTATNFREAIQADGAFGPNGYVLVSQGSSLPPVWLPFVGGPVSGRITLGAVSSDRIIPAENLTWDSSTGVLV